MSMYLYKLQKVAQGPKVLVMIGDQHLMLQQMDQLTARTPTRLGPEAAATGGMAPQLRMAMQIQEQTLVVVVLQTDCRPLPHKALQLRTEFSEV